MSMPSAFYQKCFQNHFLSIHLIRVVEGLQELTYPPYPKREDFTLGIKTTKV